MKKIIPNAAPYKKKENIKNLILSQKSSPTRDIEGLLFRWFYCSKGAISHKASCKVFAIFQRTGCIFDLYEEAVHGIILPFYFLFFSAI